MPGSLLGSAINTEITMGMRECSTCGSLPRDMNRVAHPRVVEVFAVGELWRCNCVCMICGYYTTGKTAPEAIWAWNEHHAPTGGYRLPVNASDLKAENSD